MRKQRIDEDVAATETKLLHVNHVRMALVTASEPLEKRSTEARKAFIDSEHSVAAGPARHATAPAYLGTLPSTPCTSQFID